MIPAVIDMVDDFESGYELQSSKTYRLNSNGTISGYVDETEAMQQAILKILNTERFQHLIYSWEYGVELEELIGEEMMYVIPELERRITEALLQDERITGVDGFEYEILESGVSAAFIVYTIFGDIETEKEVNY